jgi:hypothetical protein
VHVESDPLDRDAGLLRPAEDVGDLGRDGDADRVAERHLLAAGGEEARGHEGRLRGIDLPS